MGPKYNVSFTFQPAQTKVWCHGRNESCIEESKAIYMPEYKCLSRNPICLYGLNRRYICNTFRHLGHGFHTLSAKGMDAATAQERGTSRKRRDLGMRVRVLRTRCRGGFEIRYQKPVPKGKKSWRYVCPGCPDWTGPVRYGSIISLSSCSSMWQCQTYCPGAVNVIFTRVTCPG